MLDINLLPWRQKLYANTLKRKKYGIALLSLFLCALFIVMHVVLLTMINTINLHLLNLKNTQLQMDMVNQDVLLYSNFEMARASQKKMAGFFKENRKIQFVFRAN